MKKEQTKERIITENRKAHHDYFIHETYEAGIELVGTEVKSLRAGKANLKDSFARIKNNEIFIDNLHISPYEHGNIFNHDPIRIRKLLMHKAEIIKLASKVAEKGFTLVPLKMYFKRGRAKLLLGLATGKKNYDKRHALAEKTAKRDIERAMRERQKY